MIKSLLLEEIFGGNIYKWKDKYKLDYCSFCDTSVIVCPQCKNSSCSGGGCDYCVDDFKEFLSIKTSSFDYLTDDEVRAVNKAESLKKLIAISLSIGDREIDFKKMKQLGHLSKCEERLFEKELNK